MFHCTEFGAASSRINKSWRRQCMKFHAPSSLNLARAPYITQHRQPKWHVPINGSKRPSKFEPLALSGLNCVLERMKRVKVPCTFHVHPTSAFHTALWCTLLFVPICWVWCRCLKSSQTSRIHSIKSFPLCHVRLTHLGTCDSKSTYPSMAVTGLPSLIYLRPLVRTSTYSNSCVCWMGCTDLDVHWTCTM